MKKIAVFWDAHFLPLEMILAGVVALILGVWSEYFNGGIFVDNIFSGSREVLYGTLAALFGSLLGFAITAVSIILGYAANEKLEIVRNSKHYYTLWDTFNSTIRILALSTVLALVGLVIDKDTDPINLVLYINTFIVLLSFFRVARCVWILENVIAIVSKK